MNSDSPKALIEIKGKPMISYLLSTVEQIEKRPIIVLGHKAEEVKSKIGHGYHFALQEKQLGTGHAVYQAISSISPQAKSVIVLFSDQPLVKKETILRLYESHIRQNKSPLTLGTVLVDDFSDWRTSLYDFGRIVRCPENKIIKIVEKKDATEAERNIKELNPSYYCFDRVWLAENISKIKNANAQGEYYLTDLVGLAKSQGYELNSINIPPEQALGVNNLEQLNFITKFIGR